MSLDLTDVQQFVSDSTLILGKALMYTGGAGLFVMAVVGTAAIDLVLLAFAAENHNNFLTALIFMSIFLRKDSDSSPWLALLASPITSGIAIVLSLILGVPYVGAGIAAGWGIAAVITLIGYGLVELARCIEPTRDDVFVHFVSKSRNEESDCPDHEDNRYDPESDPNYEWDGSNLPSYTY